MNTAQSIVAVFAANSNGENVICVDTPRGRMVGVTCHRELVTMPRFPTRDDVVRSVQVWHPIPRWMGMVATASMHGLLDA